MYTGDTKYDVIIIGCGLAGSTLGYLLKKDGYKVLIIDHRKYHGKSKLCSGILTHRSYEILKELYDIKSLEKYAVIGRFDSFTIKSVFTATVRNVDIKVTNRKRLDIFLANQYVDADGDILEECGLLEYDFKNKTVKSGMFTFSYNILIGADGVVSQLRKILTGKYQERYVSMQYSDKPNAYKMSFEFKKAFMGYYWYIATSTCTYIGCADFKEYRYSIPEFRNAEIKKGVTSEILSGVRPTGEDIMLKSKKYKDIYFIGDAAGLTSPATGEGIYHALNSAKIMHKAITENLSYEKLMKSTIVNIKKELLYKKRIYKFFHRTLYIFFLSKKTFISKILNKKLKKNLNLD